MSHRVWFATMGVLALTWLLPYLREVVIAGLGLHLILAISCGLGAVALTVLQAGLARKGGIALLLLLCWATALGWHYLNRGADEAANWGGAIAFGLGLPVIGVGTAVLLSRLRAGATLTAIQVSTLALAAAPLSTYIALTLAMRVTGEGP